ncbi:uncharacterized protein MEPE_06342 [Melanopsichium pennsylvanicum]|uniref:Uncharacterized protein n=1 Tax=Melanopsichium pennsylvanicum TaxID=63383 RepID=A0AAJ5C856_9BASI|nr:uncharacterized protein MEPE_06342 [Melanopsichium pennsylvanicum]
MRITSVLWRKWLNGPQRREKVGQDHITVHIVDNMCRMGASEARTTVNA